MLVYDKEKNIYLLAKPIKESLEKYKILIFYQNIRILSPKERHNNRKNENIKKVLVLSKEFNKIFTKAIEIAFTDSIL